MLNVHLLLSVLDLILRDTTDILLDDFPRLQETLRKEFLSPTQVGRSVRDDLGLALWSNDFDLHTYIMADRSDILGAFLLVT